MRTRANGRAVFGLVSLFLCSWSTASATEVYFRGTLQRLGAAYTGAAEVKFALVRDGVSLWSNDGTSRDGSEPLSACGVQVSAGEIQLYLGRPPMSAIPTSALANGEEASLRVWIKNGNEFERLSDQRIQAASVSGTIAGWPDIGKRSEWAVRGRDIYKLEGNVGIGTDRPSAPLEIKSSESKLASLSTTNLQCSLLLDGAQQSLIQGSTEPTDRMVLRANSSGTTGAQILLYGDAYPTPSSTAQRGGITLSTSTNSDGDIVLLTHGQGTTRVNVLEITGGADLSEPFRVSADATNQPKPGMVVSIDEARPGALKIAMEAYDLKVAGIMSGANNLHPGMVMSAAGTAAGDGEHPVALTGRVWCWADAYYGPICPGDLLTSSNTPGFAMVATNPGKRAGAVVGKAMTHLKSGNQQHRPRVEGGTTACQLAACLTA